jgi:CRISPR-associated protein Cas1
MEPFRPLVDAKVIEIITNFNDEELTVPIKAELLKVLIQTVYFNEIKSPLMVALTKTSNSLQQCYSGTSRKINYSSLWN